MGVRITVADQVVQATNYRVSESSTPLAGGDSSGAVGTIDFDVVELPYSPVGLNGEEWVEFLDTNRGSTSGRIRQIGDSRTAGARHSVTANTRLGEFNIETQVLPFSGTLEDAFFYYCSLANIDTDITVDAAIASTQVNFPGWQGNLWTKMKEMATAMNADLNLISNVVVLRPVRLFEAVTRRETSSTANFDGTQLALNQEVVWYDTEYVANGLIYPAGGWTSDVTPLNVNAGETVTTILDTSKFVSSSIFSIQQPVPMASVPPEYDSSSVYTVAGDDGIVIQPQQWLDYGGSLSVAIGADTRSLEVTITGASGLFQASGDPIRNFRIGLSSSASSSDTYSTLRIVGEHISIKESSIIIPTGVAPWRTGQEFAPTIDNPFLNNLADAYSAGVRGARRYAGRTVSISADVVAINRRGETGTANYPPYSYAQNLWSAETYGSVKAINAGMTYSDRRAEFYAEVQDDFDNQVYGNAPGARYWDRETGRYYRVREATTDWSSMSIEGDDDLTNGDMQEFFSGKTYGNVKAHYAGIGYGKANLRGMA